MAPAASWTVGLLKPDIATGFKVGVGPDGLVEAPPGNGKIVDDVLQRIKDEGFVVEAKRLVVLSRMQVREMMRDCWDEPTFEDTLAFMTSGPCMALLLGRDQAVEHWNSVIGPADPTAAKKVAGATPPLRALHGSSLLRNAFYGSATATCALRDKDVLFPPARPSMERSLVLLKPSATCFLDAISALFEMHALYVLDQIDTVLDDDDVALIAAYPDDDAYMSELGSVAKGGRSRALILEGLEVTTKLALLLGPLDLLEAKQYFPESIRAHMGSSLVHNVLDVLSPSPSSLTKWFPGFVALLPEKTYAMIKPGASPETIAAIQARIRLLGFDILAEATQHWSREDAMAFYAEHEGKAFFPTLIAYMSSGPIVAMMLSRVKAIAMWRKCMGPTNSAAARASSPQSLRARFGIDGTKNATHGSDSSQSALRELRLVFKTPLRSLAPLKCNVLAQQLGPFQAETMTLHDALAKGLTLLCQVQPQLPPLDAAEWLGKYLIRQALHRDESEGNSVCSYDAPSSSVIVDVAQPKELLVPSLSSLHLVAFYGPSPQRAAMATAMATQYKYLYMDLTLVLEKAPPGLDLIAVLLKAFKRCTSKRVILDNCPADLSFYLAFQKVVAEFAWVVYVSDDGAFAPSPEELDFFDLFQRFGQLHIAKAAPSSSYLLDVHDAFAPTLVFVQESPRAALSTAQWRAIGVHHGWTILDWDDIVRAELKREARRSQPLLRPFIETGEQIPQQQLLALFDASVTGHRCLLLHLPAYTRNKAFMCALQRRVGATPHPLMLFLDTEPMESASMGAFEKQCFGLGRLYHQWLPGPTSVAHLCTVLAPLLAPAIGILAMDAPWAKDAARLRGYTVLNVKDVLRAEVLKRSLDGETIAALVARSEPVPDALVLAVLQRYMAQKQNRRVLLDEFPQTSAQAASMLRVLASAPAFVLQAASETLVPEAVAPLAAGAAIVTITGPNEATLSTTLCQWSISIVLGDFDLSDVEISALQARLPRHLVLHMDEVAASMQEYASDDVVKLLCFLLQRRLGKQILLVGFPRSLAEAEQFEATGSVIENVFVLHRKVLAVSHEPTDEDYYSSDEEDRARKKSAPEPEFDKLLRHFAGPRLRAFTFVQLPRVYEPICDALRPRVVLAIGHELLAPLTLAVATSHSAVHLHVPHLLEAHARAFSTPASVQDSALVAQLLRDALCRSGAQVVVVTGYPRVVGATKPYVQEQLSIITAAVGPLRKLLHLTCSATTLLERCGGDMRLVHGRTDEFAMEFAPLLHYCRRNQTLPVAEISADRSTEAVAAALRSHVAE
ncbi:hypothetical protein SPRG_19546 [Saprolegnia parasitica CBS 223.65]|uniref:Nucleoside diphosphate kinase-like domain-containing protein n=1 Tax=Saprolegnia parasitica (strain CBS 223.65) TaxID=695850 RepID=A0A067CL75_SAPPC|nr:hypothetical protein SPRG_19546 [Saprolegnia parasitica CBS 223.65]KDO31464.1 hypothetical protein SPRG_19546 [Saprolegnia parasitica CBS 223.65]|eukprot:XP_012198106.1 hypothetical protein SPRG_19546 [Saprolegnia parasitica CBS 223.65]